MQRNTAKCEQQLDTLKQLLSTVGCAEAIDQHILYPGQRREQLIRSLISRILGGLSIDSVHLGGSLQLEGLAEDERFAEKCRQLLKMLNVSASVEQLRGCSGNQEHDTALLLELARLLQAMEQQRGNSSCSRTSAPEPPAAAAPSDAAVSQLLGHVCCNLQKLTSDAMQLFASDMTDVLKTYSDQGALQQLPRLHQQASRRVQQLQQQLKQLAVAGSSRCESAGSEQWRQQLVDVEAALERLLLEMQHFDRMYQQELSVWADMASEHMQSSMDITGLHPAAAAAAAAALGGTGSTLQVAESVGQAARRIVVAYQGVHAALDGFGSIMSQHQALKDVPAAMLHEQKVMHGDDAHKYSTAAAILRPEVK